MIKSSSFPKQSTVSPVLVYFFKSSCVTRWHQFVLIAKSSSESNRWHCYHYSGSISPLLHRIDGIVALPRLRRAHPCTLPFFPLCDKSLPAEGLLSHRGKNDRVQGWAPLCATASIAAGTTAPNSQPRIQG